MCTINSTLYHAYSPSRSFPILVYFKETQTPEENWNVGPGEQANSEEALAKGAGEFCIVSTPRYPFCSSFIYDVACVPAEHVVSLQFPGKFTFSQQLQILRI